VTNINRWAARFSSFHIVKMMYSYGGRLVSSILAFAIFRQKECVEVIEFLLNKGASIDAMEYEHDPPSLSSFMNRGSAINIACCKKDSEDVVELLLSRGARIDIRTFTGRTCLDLAKEMRSQRVVNLIERQLKAEEAITKGETHGQIAEY
jgi:ankyrin repeat protein